MVIVGVTLDPELDREIVVMVIATGLDQQLPKCEPAEKLINSTPFVLVESPAMALDDNYLHIPTFIRNQQSFKGH